MGSQPSPKLSKAKVLGGVGSILAILSGNIVFTVPYAGLVPGIVGLILILVALKYISEEVGNERIFRYGLYSVLTAILAIIIAALVISFLSFLSFVIRGGTMVLPMGAGSPAMGSPLIAFSLALAIVFIFVVVWILIIVSAYLMKKSYDMIARSLGVGLFSMAALIYLIGAFLTLAFPISILIMLFSVLGFASGAGAFVVITVIGLVIIFLAAMVQAIAFFSIPKRVPEKGSTNPSPT